MRREIIYRDYLIEFSFGYYWIQGCKNPFNSLALAKETIDFWMDDALMYAND